MNIKQKKKQLNRILNETKLKKPKILNKKLMDE